MKLAKRKTKDPCLKCHLHKSRCLCDLIQPVELETRLTLVIHRLELKRSSNTGRLALLALKNSEMRVRGVTGEVLEFSDLQNNNYHNLILYPSEKAMELSSEYLSHIKKPVNLIVPDGNWRQASKVCTRYEELKAIPKVKMSLKNKSTHFLRKETTPYGMATLQAIAQAFGVIEGEVVKEQLLMIYQEKLERTLEGRGLKLSDDYKRKNEDKNLL